MTADQKETPVTYVPQSYEKDGVVDIAHTAAQGVALRFKGYKLVDQSPAADEKEPAYAELQAQARDLNATENHSIKLNASYDDLLEAVTEAQQFEDDLTAAEAQA